MSLLTEEEEKELAILRGLQKDPTRWLSQKEFDRVCELVDKQNKH